MSAQTEQKPPLTYHPSERDQSLEAIADAVEQRRVEELATRGAPAAEAPEPEAEPAKAEAPKVEDQVTKQMRKVKVDGTEMEVSDDDLVASFQKQSAASKRLAEATTARDEAARDRAEAAKILAEAQATKKPAEQAPERKEKVKAYHAALFSGDDEAAATLFDELDMGRPQASTPDADWITRVAPQVKQAVKQELDNESALSKFETEYKDIADDPFLVSVAKTHLDANLQEGKPYAEALLTAGEQTRGWLKSKGLSIVPPEPTTTSRAEKLEKKGEITQIPSTNSKAASNIEREQTPAEIIAEMRKRRGLED